jgi:hypothetical protein
MQDLHISKAYTYPPLVHNIKNSVLLRCHQKIMQAAAEVRRNDVDENVRHSEYGEAHPPQKIRRSSSGQFK